MSIQSTPLILDAAVLAHLPADETAVLQSGQRLTLPGPMVWHAWGPVDGPVVVLLHGGSV